LLNGDFYLILTKIIAGFHLSEYNEGVREFGIWLRDLSTKPLPGGVAAAAIAAAMGAALVSKATRITLQRQEVDGATHIALHAAMDLADRQQAALMNLAGADERAYRAALETRSMPASSPAQSTAWLRATEVPIRIAEACRSLLESSSPLLDGCWPAVHPDLQTGLWLLETATRAGLAAAESNIGFCGDAAEVGSFQLRIDALK
jgi:formiminotetrahydrofolate cyclodeaminase